MTPAQQAPYGERNRTVVFWSPQLPLGRVYVYIAKLVYADMTGVHTNRLGQAGLGADGSHGPGVGNAISFIAF